MEEKKTNLFREKSLEAIQSPESLNDYLRVTSPGVWLVLAAVIALLVGMILWSVFGRIDTRLNVAVTSSQGKAVCYVPYDNLQKVMKSGKVTVEDKEYALVVTTEPEVVIVSESMNPYTRIAGALNIGDMTVEVPLETAPEDGVYTGTVVTESLQPISLLLKQ